MMFSGWAPCRASAERRTRRNCLNKVKIQLDYPYGSNHDTWKWLYIIHKLAKSTKKQTPSFHSIQSRIPKFQNTPWVSFSTNATKFGKTPWFFFNLKDSRLDSQIPTWDISLDELVEFYVRAYQERFIYWTNDIPEASNECKRRKIQYRRRIPWLISYEGKYDFFMIFGKK